MHKEYCTLVLVVISLLIGLVARSQNCTSCTYTINGNDAGSYSVSSGQTFCITATGNFTGSISMSDGSILCNQGAFNPSGISGGDPEVHNYGTFRYVNNYTLYYSSFTNYATGTVDLSQNFKLNNVPLVNEGNITVGYDIDFGGGSDIINRGTITTANQIYTWSDIINEGSITTGSRLKLVNGKLTNNGTINVGTYLNMGDSLQNNCSIIVTTYADIWANVINNGYLEVGGELKITNGTLVMISGAYTKAGSTDLGDIAGGNGPACSKLQVIGEMGVWGGDLTGLLDYCAGSEDFVSVNIASTVTNCDAGCTANGQTGLCSSSLIAVAGEDITICSGETQTIGGNPTATGGSEPYVFAWSPVTGLSSSAIANPDANPAATTTYTLTVTDNNGNQATDEVVITVLPVPTANAGPDKSLCGSGSVQVGGNPAGPANATFAWSPSTGLNSTTIANPDASPSVTTTYTVTVTDTNGCFNVDQVIVSVEDNCQPAGCIPGGQAQELLGYLNALTKKTVIGPSSVYASSPPTAFQVWCDFIGDVLCDKVTESNQIYGASVSSDGSAYFRVSWYRKHVNTAGDTFSCLIKVYHHKSTEFNSTVKEYFDLEPDPVRNLQQGNTRAFIAKARLNNGNIIDVFGNSSCKEIGCCEEIIVEAGPDQVICQGQTASLSAFSVFPVSFSWSPESSIIGNPSAPFIQVNPSVTTTYTVVATDISGCIGSDKAIVVVSNGSGDGIVVTGDKNICAGACTQLKVLGIQEDIIWEPLAGLIPNPYVPDPVVCPAITTTYRVSGIDSECLSGRKEKTIVVTVGDAPEPEITPPQITCGGNPVQLSVTGGLQCEWSSSSGGFNEPVSCTVNVSPDTTTTYTVIVTNEAGCSAEVSTVVGVEEFDDKVRVIPDQLLCEESTVHLFAEGGLKYEWSPPTGLSCTTCSDPFASPAHTTNYTVEITTDLGCVVSRNVLVTVGAELVVDAGPDLSICPGEEQILTATGAEHYVWSPATGLSCPTCASTRVLTDEPVTYVVTGFRGNCQATDQVNVGLQFDPADISFNYTVNPDCSVDFEAFPEGLIEYEWTFNHNAIAEGRQASYVFGNSGLFEVRLKVTTACDTYELRELIFISKDDCNCEGCGS